MSALVMTLMGQDRPGLVESLAETVAKFGANWLESRMAHLAGQFAGILLVDVPAGQAQELVAALRELDQKGLTVVVEPDSGLLPQEAIDTVQLELVGNDRPGIVREITHVLTENGVNVEDFRTNCTTAPMSGAQLFRAFAKLRLPPSLSRDELRSRLETIAQDLMVDIRLAASEGDA